MSLRSLLPAPVERYVLDQATRETPVAAKLREETAKLPEGGMQIGPDEAAFLAALIRLTHARRALEIGTFTGYSALAVASALPADGKLVCCDISDEWTSVGRRYWSEAGVAKKIDLRLALAKETLPKLKAEVGPGSFDYVFIDADKTGADFYYEASLELLRAGGVVAIDNTLWSGAVADPKRTDADTEALRQINRKIRDDPRVDMCLLTVGDGVTLAIKR